MGAKQEKTGVAREAEDATTVDEEGRKSAVDKQTVKGKLKANAIARVVAGWRK